MENNNKRKELTPRQEEILEYIKKYSKENRMPPTVREIGNHFEISSTNGVRSILAALIKKGYINRSPRLSRGIEVITDGKDENMVEAPSNTIEFPIVGRVAAGLRFSPSRTSKAPSPSTVISSPAAPTYLRSASRETP